MPNVQQISLLCRKPVKILSPNSLGWIRPDGMINFSTKSAAKIYAINSCRTANKLKDKFERGIIVKDNIILSETNGKNVEAELDFSKINDYKDCDLYHNHPLPGTLSWDDYAVLISQKCLKTITAIDIAGRYYTMIKLPYKRIKSLPIKFSNLINRQIIDRLHVLKAGLKSAKIESEYQTKFAELNKELKEQDTDQLIEEFKKSILSRKIKEAFFKRSAKLDKMWQNNASKLGIKYEHGKIG